MSNDEAQQIFNSGMDALANANFFSPVQFEAFRQACQTLISGISVESNGHQDVDLAEVK